MSSHRRSYYIWLVTIGYNLVCLGYRRQVPITRRRIRGRNETEVITFSKKKLKIFHSLIVVYKCCNKIIVT